MRWTMHLTLKTAANVYKCCSMMQVLLPVMIFTAGPISGAHFNPMVTSVFVMARMQVMICLQKLLGFLP